MVIIKAKKVNFQKETFRIKSEP